MKNSPYWKQRFEQLEAASNKDAIATFNVVQEQYIAAEKEIEKQISTWYKRFAKNNQISMAEARKLMTTGELAEFKWDVKEFIKYGHENELNPIWMKELENASAKFHISRLEALRIETQQTVEKLFGGQTDEVDKLLKKNYLKNYYHTVYEVQKGFNIGWDIAAIDDRTVERLISKPWATDAKNFSDRIWSNKSSLINEVQTQLTRTFMLGKSPDDAIDAIAKKMKSSKNQAGRLVMTESAYFSSQSQKDAFNSLDVERFEIVATLDSHTSAICQELDGKVFDMKNFEPGITAPPFHPWCRTTTVPYFDDNFTERAARGEDGKTYYVDSKMKYKDWKKSFTDGGSKNGLEEVIGDKIKENPFMKLYNKWDGVNVKDFATELVNHEQLPFKVNRHVLNGANGQCRLNYMGSEMEVLTYELHSKDIRDVEYQVKTAFHELFHAKSNGLVHDIGEISFQEWAYVDDVFAEVTAHHLTKSVGITKEIAPSYASHLVKSLPKLKTLPEFSSCNTIADFGEVAYRYRFSDAGNAQWKSIFDVINSSNDGVIDYSKKYISYIEENKSELVDKLLENMPKFSNYKSNMVGDIDTAIKNINDGYELSGNEKMVFENALIIAMNRLGVK